MSRTFWPFSNNSRLFQDFRRLTKMCEDCQRCQKTTEHFQEEIRNSLWPSSPKRNGISIYHCCCVTMLLFSVFPLEIRCNRPIRLTQCCTQFKSLEVKVLCTLHLHDNVAFTFKWYGNTWNKTFYSQIGYNIELAESVYLNSFRSNSAIPNFNASSLSPRNSVRCFLTAATLDCFERSKESLLLCLSQTESSPVQ